MTIDELEKLVNEGPGVVGGCYLDTLNREWLREALRKESLHRYKLQDAVRKLIAVARTATELTFWQSTTWTDEAQKACAILNRALAALEEE